MIITDYFRSTRDLTWDAADARDGYGATGRLFALGYLKGLVSYDAEDRRP